MAGILGTLTVGFTDLMASSLMGQQKLMEVRNISDLKNEMGMLLDSEKHCRNSLAGEGKYGAPTTPVTFKKTNIDEYKDEDSVNVELFVSNQAGTKRAQKMFTYKNKSSQDKNLSRYSTLAITSIKLLMNTDNQRNDYAPSEEHEDIGTLRITVQKLDGQKESFDIKLSVWMRTDEHQETTLLSCSRSSSTAPRCGESQVFHPKCGCVVESYTGSPSAKVCDLFVEGNLTVKGNLDVKGKIVAHGGVSVMNESFRVSKGVETTFGNMVTIAGKDGHDAGLRVDGSIVTNCWFGTSRKCPSGAPPNTSALSNKIDALSNRIGDLKQNLEKHNH